MKKKALAAIIIAMGVLAGCANSDIPSPIQTLEPEPIVTVPPEAEPTSEPIDNSDELSVIKDREVVSGKMQSYLTGEWKNAEVVQRRPFAIMIPNNKPALPQYGLSAASIIYEAPMESGSCTRLMAIVEDYDDLDHIGPVRSARDYFMYEALAYDAIYCNWGLAVPYVSPVINTDRVDNVSQAVSGIDKPSSEAFDRIDRGSGYATEFTGYMFINGYNKAVTRHKYATEYHDTFEQAFTFANEGVVAEYKDFPEATTIRPGGTASSSGGYDHVKPYFTYKDGLYYRYQNGGAMTDEMNGEQLAVSNVVFKVCYGEIRDDHGYLAFRVHGTGEAYVFTNGKVIHGTWQRNSDYEPNLFLDDEGNEIVFNQGKTWICNIWEKYADCISYE